MIPGQLQLGPGQTTPDKPTAAQWELAGVQMLRQSRSQLRRPKTIMERVTEASAALHVTNPSVQACIGDNLNSLHIICRRSMDRLIVKCNEWLKQNAVHQIKKIKLLQRDLGVKRKSANGYFSWPVDGLGAEPSTA